MNLMISACFGALLSCAVVGAAQAQLPVGANSSSIAPRDGQAHFDFNFGVWKTHVRRLLHPLAGASSWAEYDGTSVVSKVWGGRASLLELDVEGSGGHLEGFGLRLYDPQSHQWSLNWVSGSAGEFDQPMIGQFEGNRGVFVDQELFSGKVVLARNAFSDITPDFSRFEQAFSEDGARTWEPNWVMTFARMPASVETPPLKAQSAYNPTPVAADAIPLAHDGQQDFDFAFGTWTTHIKRLKTHFPARPIGSSMTVCIRSGE